VSAVIAAKQIIVLLLPFFKITLPSSSFWWFSDFHMTVGLGAFFSFLAVRPALRARFKRFAQHFANSVYRNFYVWFKRQSM
jgi:hypothetical protein